MSIFKKQILNFRLDFNGKTVGELVSSNVDSEITIGRSGKCFLRIPLEDRSASSVHAKIYRKGKNFYILDLDSRNGIYFMGEKIKEHKLAPGEIYSIGDSKLNVEEYHEETAPVSQEQYHKLEQLTGRDRGKIYRLTEDNIKIGAADSCTIVLNDSLVSHLHAVLENHPDGTCWVIDQKSRNGTKVNGTPLTEENATTGRMLKDGDIISIAYLDFRFWDKSVVHIRSHLFLKVGIVAATLAVALGGYFAFQTVSPSAKSLRLKAEGFAAAGNFDAAREILQSATTARGAETDSAQRLDLMRKLGIWQETLTTWLKIQRTLSGKPGEGDFYDANNLFAKLASADRERWQWNVSKASVEMKKALQTHALLSTLLGAEEQMRQTEKDISFMLDLRKKLASALAECRKNPQPYQTAIASRAGDLVSEMDRLIAETENIRQVMAGCVSADRIDRTIASLTKIGNAANSRMAMRKKSRYAYSPAAAILCEKLLAILRDLQESKKIIDANYLHIARFEFNKFAIDPQLPSVESCILSPSLSARRLEMEQENLRLKQAAVQLRNFQAFFKNSSIAPGMKSPVLTSMFDGSVWEKVLACDCLQLPQPSYTEKTVRSLYDRMLGVYAFWEYLRSIGGDFDTTIFEERFKPDLFKSRDIFSHLEIFLTFCRPNARSPFHRTMAQLTSEKIGPCLLAEYIRTARSLLAQRDRLIQRMYAVYSGQPDTRAGIIAGGIALYLIPEDGKMFNQAQLAERVGTSLKKLRAKLAKLSERKQDSTPEQQLANENEIMKLGIPGDAFLKQPWTDRAGKGKK